MKHFFYIFLAHYFLAFGLYAMQPDPSGKNDVINAIISGDRRALDIWRAEEFQRKRIVYNASLLDVNNYVVQLLRENQLPRSILLILDNDGTLTQSNEPSDKVQSRGRSTQMVKTFREKDVHVVVSSAWDEFRTTLNALEELDIADDLLVNQNDIIEISSQSWPFVEGYMSGLVCSVRRADSDDQYFRQKALAPFFTCDNKSIGGYRWVIFADDSLHNITLFNTDIELLGLRPDTVITMFYLSPSQNEPDWPII